jgi:hypothetical protein
VTRLLPFLALLLVPVLARAAAPVVPVAPVSTLHPGQQALVRTVFVGDSIETFTAEIVGVLPGGRAEGDMILARATDPRVILTGVAQGMSGSPVYVDGRLIGALSSGWAFSKEPIFGITPIGEMLAVLDQPDADTDESVGPTGIDPQARATFRGLSWEDSPDRPDLRRDRDRVRDSRSRSRSAASRPPRRIGCGTCSRRSDSRSFPADGSARRPRGRRRRSSPAVRSRWMCCAAISTSRRSAP